MKIIATGDWHLGNTFHGIDRLEEHRHFLSWLIARMEDISPAALLVAGDVFDNGNPSAASQNAYYSFLAEASRRCPQTKIIITAGNHDSAGRLEAPRPMLANLNVEVRGNVRRHLIQDAEGNMHRAFDFDDLMIPIEGSDTLVLAVPFLRSDITEGKSYSKGVLDFLKQLTAHARTKYPAHRIVMMAHLYAKGADIAASDASEKILIGGQEEVILGNWDDHPDYLTCGHIHKRQHIWNTKWARYAGSVIPMSFAEKDYSHGVDLITFGDDGSISTEQIVYTPTHKLRVIPDNDELLTPAALIKIIRRELPDREEGDKYSENADYVLLKVKLDKDDADEIRELESAVALKNAVLCKIQKLIPKAHIHVISGNDNVASVDDVINRDPLQTLMETFLIKKSHPLNDTQIQLLRNMISEINITDDL